MLAVSENGLSLHFETVMDELREERNAQARAARDRARREGRPLTIDDYPDVTVGEVRQWLREQR